MTPIMFYYDNKKMIVSSNKGRDKAAIYRYDPITDVMGEMLYGHDKVDVTNLMTSRKQQKIIGVSYSDDFPEQFYFDAKEKRFSQQLTKIFKGKIVRTSSMNDDETLRVITVSSDTDPGTYYLWDEIKKKIIPFGNRVSKIDKKELSPMKPFEFTSRDGLTLRGYITIPKNTDGKKIPLIINPHGGPFGVRDGWGYNVQTMVKA